MQSKQLVIAALASAIVIIGVEVAPAAGDATVAAKKKRCAPGFVKVKVKNKRKCRPAAGPRATLTWTNASGSATDVDLVVWDSLGVQSGGAGPTGIADSAQTGDNQAFGPEVFTDERTPSIRNFTIAACMSNDNGTDDTVATLVFRGPDGLTRTVTSLPGQLADDHSFVVLYQGDFIPGATPFCA